VAAAWMGVQLFLQQVRAAEKSTCRSTCPRIHGLRTSLGQLVSPCPPSPASPLPPLHARRASSAARARSSARPATAAASSTA
jgi:hypothetical protein